MSSRGKQLHLIIREDLFDRLYLIAKNNDTSVGHMTRKAIALLVMYYDLKSTGGKLIVEDTNGSRELVLL